MDVTDTVNLERDRPGRPSMSDVAAFAGVSKGAVSKVIRNAYGVSPEMRQRVEAAIEHLGYRPLTAARVMRGASYTLGFEIPQLGNEYMTLVLQGAAARLAGSAYQLSVVPVLDGRPSTSALEALVDRQVDGIIAVSPDVEPDDLERIAREVPMVMLGRHDPSTAYDTVTSDDGGGASLMMEHLLAIGHREIAHITTPIPAGISGTRLPHSLRRHAYVEAMAAHGLTPEIVYAGPLEPDGYDAAVALLRRPNRPTAIFAGNDSVALGAMRAAAEFGLSTEVSIGGYDDISIASNPLVSLTTVDQFGADSGAQAIELLLGRIGGRTNAEHRLIKPELRVRNSTRPPLLPPA